MSEPRYWEDYEVGRKYPLGSTSFTEQEIVDFGRQYDPQPFHVDPAAAKASMFGGLIASGWHTAAVWLRLLVEDRHRRQAELRRRGEMVAKTGPSPGLRNLQWPRPVYAGDTIAYAHEVVELRPLADRGDVGLRVARNTGTNQHGGLVYSVLSSTFIERREKQG